MEKFFFCIRKTKGICLTVYYSDHHTVFFFLPTTISIKNLSGQHCKFKDYLVSLFMHLCCPLVCKHHHKDLLVICTSFMMIIYFFYIKLGYSKTFSGLSEDGIYRRNGIQSRVTALLETFEKGTLLSTIIRFLIYVFILIVIVNCIFTKYLCLLKYYRE